MSGLDFQIYNFIRQFAVDHGYLPVIKEIGDVFNLSIKAIYYHLSKLENNGYIFRTDTGMRYGVKGLKYVMEG